MQNIDSYSTSICNLTAEIAKLEQEIPCWRQKLHNSYKDLEKMKHEIKSSKLANILHIYLKAKHFEVQSSKQLLINKHITNIDTEVVINAHWLQRAFTLATDVIKNGNLNAEQRYHYDQLQRHLLGTTLNVRHNDLEVGETLLNGIHPTASDDDVEQICIESNASRGHCSKRLRLEEYDLDDLDGMTGNSDYDDEDGQVVDMQTTFKMPVKKPRANLNETQIVSVDANLNATFFMGPSSSCTKKNVKNGRTLPPNKNNLVTNVLSDQIVKGPANSEQLKNGK